MAVQTLTGLSILHGGLEVATLCKGFSGPLVTAEAKDVTSLADSWVKLKGGLKSFTWNAQVMADFANDGLDELAFGQLGTANVPVTLLPAGSTAGSMAHLFPTLPLQYTPLDGTVGDVAMGVLSGAGSGPAARGFLLHDTGTARTSSTSSTGVEVGAVTAAQRLYGALHVTAASGTTPSLTVKVQSSATQGGSYSDRITFTAETDATAHHQWSSVAGAVTDTWWRITWTISGTDPSFTFAVSAGVAAA